MTDRVDPIVGTVTVVGAAGAVGSLFARRLASDGIRIVGIDREPNPTDVPWADFLTVDVIGPITREAREVLEHTEVMIVALPESIAFQALDRLVPELPRGALLADVFSVKAPVAAWLQTARTDLEVLSLQPFFAPDLDFPGQNVAAVEFVPGPRSLWLQACLADWGARITLVDAATHDSVCALNQVAVHAALLAYGLAVDALGAEVGDLAMLSTPQSRALLNGVTRIATLNPAGYWAIQTGNPHGTKARSAVQTGLQELMRWIEGNDRAAFEDALHRLGERLSSPRRNRTP